MTGWHWPLALVPVIALGVGVGIGGAFLAGNVSGQDTPAAKVKAAPAAKPAARPAPVPAQPAAAPTATAPAPQAVMPDAQKIVLLLRTSLLTLNDALRTGNYTVLLGTASPAFREANPPARLAQIFAPLAQQGIDLSAVAITGPQLTEPPALDQNSRLRLKGFFPGHPLQTNFEAVFEPVDGRWRLLGVAVVPSQPPPLAQTGALPAPPRAAPSKPAAKRP